MPNKSSKSKKSQNTVTNKLPSTCKSIVLFGFSVLMFCIVVFPGENIWFIIHNFVLDLFGICSILWPILSGCTVALEAMGKSYSSMRFKIFMSIITIVFSCSMVYVFSNIEIKEISSNFFGYIFSQYSEGNLRGNSGFLGAIVGALMAWAFGILGARITNAVVLFICLMFLTSTTLAGFFDIFIKPIKAISEKLKEKKDTFNNFDRKKIFGSLKSDTIGSIGNSDNNRSDSIFEALGEKDEKFENKSSDDKSEIDDISKVTERFLAKINNNSTANQGNDTETNEMISTKKSKNKKEKIEEVNISVSNLDSDVNYQFPSANLLDDVKVQNNEDISAELNNNGKMLVDTLKSFNVSTRIIDISRGPSVTRYELQPASGVKISKITTLADDIALNLAASGVRIEAPIPGKAAVGVEIPNKVVSMVGMKELITSPDFANANSKLMVVLGRDISGNVVTADLAKMPHLLIAGSTGSGKSVCINSFIISILYNASPDEVKLLMIDPKVVELGVYNGIPHLLVPVVTEPRKAAGTLNWAVNEMLKRYKRFADTGVRELHSYNALVEENPDLRNEEGEPLEKMPQIVIIIDELSDLMMAAPNEMEDYICRLAQMARAAGMHLVIATQRPSVDVITGIIKANIPSRIALAVSSQIDSRTILDMSGAEKLLGRGDMLFAPIGCNKPIRVQGCYVTDKEIERIINFIKSSQKSNYDDEVAEEIEKGSIKSKDMDKKDESKSEDEVDPMMAEAIKCVVEVGQASTSLLQRRLRVGYARAGRLVDEMEKMGIVGPHEGSKPRQVLITHQQLLEMNLTNRE